MTAITLESLGLSKEQLQEMLLEKMVEQALVGISYDDEGDAYRTDTSFATQLKKRVREQIDASINALAAQHVLPNVAQYIENLTLQATTSWGEKKGEPMTFVQYLTSRAEAYMQEQVDFDGKAKGQDSYGSWTGKQTRLVHLIHQHLHYTIQEAVKTGLGIGQKAVAEAIQSTVKAQLANMVTQFKLGVEVKDAGR